MPKFVAASASGFSIELRKTEIATGSIDTVVLRWQGEEVEAMQLSTWRELVRQWNAHEKLQQGAVV